MYFQLTTSRIDILTRLIHNLLYVMTIHPYVLYNIIAMQAPRNRGKCKSIRGTWVYLGRYVCCTVFGFGIGFKYRESRLFVGCTFS